MSKIQIILSVAFLLMAVLSASHAEDERLIDWQKLIRSGDILSIKQHIEIDGVPPESLDRRGRTLLRIAIEHKQHHIIDSLLKNHADINQPSADGQRALHVAAYSQNIAIVKLLLANGADPNLSNHHGETPLYSAMFYGYGDIAIEMLKKSGDLDIANKDGDTPFTHAPPRTVAMVQAFLDERDAQNRKKQAKLTVQQETEIFEDSEAQAQAQIKRLEYAAQQKAIRQQALVAHQKFIARIRNRKKRTLRWAHQQLQDSGIIVLSNTDQPFMLQAVFTPASLPPVSPLYGFVPVNEDTDFDTDSDTRIENDYQGALDNYLNLRDHKPAPAQNTKADAESAQTPLSKDLQTLKRARAESIAAYQALLRHDALILGLQPMAIGRLAYDEDNQQLAITLHSAPEFALHHAEYLFEIDNVPPDTAAVLIANPETIEWRITYRITREAVMLDDAVFSHAQ